MLQDLECYLKRTSHEIEKPCSMKELADLSTIKNHFMFSNFEELWLQFWYLWPFLCIRLLPSDRFHNWNWSNLFKKFYADKKSYPIYLLYPSILLPKFWTLMLSLTLSLNKKSKKRSFNSSRRQSWLSFFKLMKGPMNLRRPDCEEHATTIVMTFNILTSAPDILWNFSASYFTVL